MSKRKIQKGLSLELRKSVAVHQKLVPVLISSAMLRRIGCGQIDLCGIEKLGEQFLIRVYEVKSSGYVSATQRRRLYRSAHFLSQYFDISCTVLVI